ncbi:MAG: methionyl-tRNA formyltransferase [Arcanobacterium sp.]|nr:methionyl-tRNA formyltransferase [Arcanobacterium sp.]
MKLIFAGTPAVAVPALKELAAHHEVLAVLTRAPAPQGRKRVLTPSPVHEAAQKLGLSVLTPLTLKEPAAIAQLEELHADAVAVVAYGLIVPPAALEVTRFGWFNLHFSSLPKWRGAAPVQYALAAGESTIGTTVFQIEAGLDTGPIVNAEEHLVNSQATAGNVLAQLAELGAVQLTAALESIEAGTAQFTEQRGEPSYAPSLSTADSHIAWDQPAQQVVNAIRAYTPEPGAWSVLNGQRVKISGARLHEDSQVASANEAREQLAPGELLLTHSSLLLVGTGTSPIELVEVTPAGKRTMEAAAWARGIHGEQLRFELCCANEPYAHHKQKGSDQ